MAATPYTISEQNRITGFNANLSIRGRAMTTDTGEKVVCLVQNAVELPDPNKPAQAKKPVYAIITCLAGALKDPRMIGLFMEGTGDSQQKHTVMSYDETSGDRVTWKFQVETQRENYAED